MPRRLPPPSRRPGAIGVSGCDCAAAYPGDIEAVRACQTCQLRQHGGPWPLPRNARKFVVCGVDGPAVRQCGGTLTFNTATKTCT